MQPHQRERSPWQDSREQSWALKWARGTVLGAVPSLDRPRAVYLACSHSTPPAPPPLRPRPPGHQSFQRLLQLICAPRPVSIPKGSLAFMALSLPAHTSYKRVPRHSCVHTHTPSPHTCTYSTPTPVTHTPLHAHRHPTLHTHVRSRPRLPAAPAQRLCRRHHCLVVYFQEMHYLASVLLTAPHTQVCFGETTYLKSSEHQAPVRSSEMRCSQTRG